MKQSFIHSINYLGVHYELYSLTSDEENREECIQLREKLGINTKTPYLMLSQGFFF